LDLNPGHKILDVGCGTGYSTAVFATLGNNVIGLESDPALANKARQALARLGLVNLTVVTGEFAEGYPAEAPFDAICVNGSIPEPPLALLAQLKNPGRLAAVVGRYEVGQVAIFTRDGGFSLRYAFDASVPRLPGFDSDKAPFHFERPKL
jgi:protein-L-isoaspartate(D-aspartate) O-methyltransferase